MHRIWDTVTRPLRKHAEAEALRSELADLRPVVPPLPPAQGRSFRSELAPRTIASFSKGVFKTRYRGVRMFKNPIDLAHYTVLCSHLRPRTVIEIGSKDGGSALFFADLLRAHRPDGRVLSIDLEPPDVEDPLVEFRRGDARALGEAIPDDELATLAHPILVVEDSAHFYETTIAVLEFFHPHLRKGDYMVVEDGLISSTRIERVQQYEHGPNRAVAAFLDAHDGNYEIDSRICDRYGYNVTWCPNGWLRRVR